MELLENPVFLCCTCIGEIELFMSNIPCGVHSHFFTIVSVFAHEGCDQDQAQCFFSALLPIFVLGWLISSTFLIVLALNQSPLEPATRLPNLVVHAETPTSLSLSL
jgi:hypothetical protein